MRAISTAIFSLLLTFTLITGVNTLSFAMGSKPPAPKDYCETEYPIMLVPGVSGFKTLIGFVDYWWQIPTNLRRSGATVRCVSLSACIGTEERGEQLLMQVEEFLAETGKDKVHLIGHSHGTTTSRYVACVRPDLVASVTAIAGPHRIMPTAKEFDDFTDLQKNVIAFGMDLFGEMFNILGNTNWPQNSKAMIADFSEEGTNSFNQKYPYGVPTENDAMEGDYYSNIPMVDESGEEKEYFVRFYSWTGAAGGGTNELDPVDFFFIAFGEYTDSLWTEEYKEMAGEIAHDSMVPVWSARFGKVIREDYHWNHLDESNMMFGLISPFASNPISVLRQHANRLQKDEK